MAVHIGPRLQFLSGAASVRHSTCSIRKSLTCARVLYFTLHPHKQEPHSRRNLTGNTGTRAFAQCMYDGR